MPVRLPIVGTAPDPLAPLRRAVAGNMQAAFTVDRFPQEQYTDPPGDAGLFGPDSVTWRVHGHPSAIIGGFSSLMLQALHPLVMAGVAEHSTYKEDPLGRLGRTASFVGGTTYGSTEVAEAMIATVKAVHRHVRGIAPDGRPYVATDPELVTWVHVAEMGSILWAHRRYHRPVRGTDLDRYFEETAVVAEKLGGTGIPRSRAEVRDYFHDIRGELVADTQAIEALAFIMQPMGRNRSPAVSPTSSSRRRSTCSRPGPAASTASAARRASTPPSSGPRRSRSSTCSTRSPVPRLPSSRPRPGPLPRPASPSPADRLVVRGSRRAACRSGDSPRRSATRPRRATGRAGRPATPATPGRRRARACWSATEPLRTACASSPSSSVSHATVAAVPRARSRSPYVSRIRSWNSANSIAAGYAPRPGSPSDCRGRWSSVGGC